MKKLVAAMMAVVLGVVLAGPSAHAYSPGYRSYGYRSVPGSPRGGLRFGVNLAKVTGEPADYGIDESKLGFSVGATFDIPVNHAVSFQTGFGYTQKGGEGSVDASTVLPWYPPGTMVDVEIALDYVEVPFLVKAASGGDGPYALAGISLGLNMKAEVTAEFMGSSDTSDMEDSTEDYELSLIVGAGVSFGHGSGTVGIQYSLGLTDVDEGANGEIKTETLSVILGVSF